MIKDISRICEFAALNTEYDIMFDSWKGSWFKIIIIDE